MDSMTDETVNNQRRLPDPEICRTRSERHTFGSTDCLVENPSGCEYAVRSVSGFHCYHPDRRNFEKADQLETIAVVAELLVDRDRKTPDILLAV
jgi:hypothetical protein